MTTQRDRLASAIGDHRPYASRGYARCSCGWKLNMIDWLTSLDYSETAPHPFGTHVVDTLLARGVRVVDDPERFDRDDEDAQAEARFLRPINPDPLTTFAKANKVKP